MGRGSGEWGTGQEVEKRKEERRKKDGAEVKSCTRSSTVMICTTHATCAMVTSGRDRECKQTVTEEEGIKGSLQSMQVTLVTCTLH